MIYLLLFWEFFKIGLLAIGGGLATVPFLFELAETYSWFDTDDLANMIAVAETTPGPIGVNMATFAGFNVGGVTGGIVATLGLIMPSLIIIILLAKYLGHEKQNLYFDMVLKTVRPAVLGLILYAGFMIAKITVVDSFYLLVLLGAFILVHFVKVSPICYIILGAVGGMIFL